MKQGQQKAKGNNYESLIAKQLSLWLTNNIREDVLMRAPTSGARSTVLQRLGKDYSNQAGDIIAVAEEGLFFTNQFLIECKHRKSIGIENLFFQTGLKTPSVHVWWSKLIMECNQWNRLPFLVARQNNRTDWLFISKKGASLLHCGKYISSYFVHPSENIYCVQFKIVLENSHFNLTNSIFNLPNTTTSFRKRERIHKAKT